MLRLEILGGEPKAKAGAEPRSESAKKQGKKFRFLYSGGINENSAFKEVISQDIDMQPKYIGLFAIKGFKDSTSVIPAHFTFFRIAGNPCK